MNVSKILSQVLLEREENKSEARGINYNNTFEVLNSGKISPDQSCASLKGLGEIKQMTPTSPTTDDKTPIIRKFKEIYNLNSPDGVAYASIKAGDGRAVVFGVVDPNTQSGQRGLYAYTLNPGQSPERIIGGAGTGCIELQKFEDVGKVPLSDYDKGIVNSMYGKFGVLYDTPDKTQMGNYEKIFLKDIPGVRNPQNGFIWVQKSDANINYGNDNKVNNQKLIDQGFTSIKPEGEARNYGFLLSMVRNNVGQGGRDTDPYWVDVTSDKTPPSLDPDRQTCRAAIKKLHGCMKQAEKSGGQTSSDCNVDVVKNKFTALRCRIKNFVGGPIGIGNEFDDLVNDKTASPYGLRGMKLSNISAKAPGVTNESIDSKINRLLNEEHKKFSFVKKETPKFDQEIVENLSTQLVLSAYFDLQESLNKLNKLNKLNENVFGDIAGALGSNFGDKLIQGGKEMIAKKVISALGLDPNTFIGLLVVNIFANLEIKDYPGLLSNCKKYTAVIVKSALEAWLDMAAQKMGGGSMEGFVYSALKNTVTETAANTTVFKKLEKLASSMVCPLIEGISGSVQDGSLDLF